LPGILLGSAWAASWDIRLLIVGGQDRSAGHVFISYRRQDLANAERLHSLLEDAGIRVWRDTSDLWPGDDWRLEIRRAISDGTLVFLACFSTASITHTPSWQIEELNLAAEQMRLRPPQEPWLIPVRFDDCEIPDIDVGAGRTLRSIHYCNMFGDEADNEAARLVATVQRILGRLLGSRATPNPAPVSRFQRAKPIRWTGSQPLGDAGEGGDVHFGSPAEMPVPSQLLPTPANFTDRARELAVLRGILGNGEPERPLTLAVIVGVGGVGKTSLALRWLHEVRRRYPDGQLYADLGGHLPSTTARPGDVLGRFLRALAIPPERIPLSLDEMAALYRSVTDGRRLVVMLDDAASAAQVRTLLPGPGPSLVAVTTRWRIAGLAIDGAHFTELRPLEEADAVELLGRVAGPARIQAEPLAALHVVRLCGGLPLAVCVSGARLAPRPSWPVEQMAGELASERDRLGALSLTGDLSVRAAFDVSYQGLPAEVARMYRQLSLVPGYGFGLDLAVAASATDLATTSRLLDALTGASLLEETAGGWFRFHDLVRLHAREQADIEPDTDQGAVIARSVQWYLQAAVAADLAVIPGRWQLGSLYEHARQLPSAYESPAEALDWLDQTLPGLLAALGTARDHGLHEQAWQLCEAMWGLFLYRKHFRDWIDSTQVGVAAAQASGDRRAEARMRDQLGFAYLNLNRYADATDQFTQAMELAQQAGHRLGEAAALANLGLTLLGLRRPDEALGQFEMARTIHWDLGRSRGVALMTRHIGEAHRDAGRYLQAIDALAEARHVFAALPDAYNEARTKTSLAQTYLLAGRPADAPGPLNQALVTLTSLGARYKQADVHVSLADAAGQLADPGRERLHLEQALAIYAEVGAPEEGQIRQRLDALGLEAEFPAMPSEDNTAPP
jgi:tetratricopeptide (TPR) repeat protein